MIISVEEARTLSIPSAAGLGWFYRDAYTLFSAGVPDSGAFQAEFVPVEHIQQRKEYVLVTLRKVYQEVQGQRRFHVDL